MATKKTASKKQDSEQRESPDTPIRVRATRVGIYGHVRRRVGEEFTIAKREDLGTWMDELDAIDAPAPAGETEE